MGKKNAKKSAPLAKKQTAKHGKSEMPKGQQPVAETPAPDKADQ